jgi:alpha-glutamyl/putrescinyl thymine pyrophosphorylase clade 1
MVNQRNLALFFEFMYERHNIWYKRNVLKEPAPWTDNKILRDNKFTNIYRELDAGTIWYVQNVYPKATECWREDLGRSERNLIWYTVQYRLLNRVETFEKVGFVDHWKWPAVKLRWLAALKSLMEKGESIFTSAHRTCPTHEPGQTRLQVFEESLEYTIQHLPMLWEDIHRARCLEDVFKTLRTIPNVGDFISYEICCDFMLVGLIPFKEDDWVNPGPGCRAGTLLIFPETSSTEEFQQRILWLRNNQRAFFENMEADGKDFNRIKIHDLTLRSIEHSLCEFSKYYRCLKGGRTRVKFKPRDGSSQYGQLPLRWTRTK